MQSDGGQRWYHVKGFYVRSHVWCLGWEDSNGWGLEQLEHTGHLSISTWSPPMDIPTWQLQDNQLSYMGTRLQWLERASQEGEKDRWKPYHLLGSSLRRSLNITSLLPCLGKADRKICPGVRGGNTDTAPPTPPPSVSGGLSKSHWTKSRRVGIFIGLAIFGKYNLPHGVCIQIRRQWLSHLI